MSTADLRGIVDPLTDPAGVIDGLNYPYFQAGWDRKSRRVALGIEITTGPLTSTTPYQPISLSETEEALLLMAATGLNGLNLGDIDPTQGAVALVQWTARSWPSWRNLTELSSRPATADDIGDCTKDRR